MPEAVLGGEGEWGWDWGESVLLANEFGNVVDIARGTRDVFVAVGDLGNGRESEEGEKRQDSPSHRSLPTKTGRALE